MKLISIDNKGTPDYTIYYCDFGDGNILHKSGVKGQPIDIDKNNSWKECSEVPISHISELIFQFPMFDWDTVASGKEITAAIMTLRVVVREKLEAISGANFEHMCHQEPEDFFKRIEQYLEGTHSLHGHIIRKETIDVHA